MIGKLIVWALTWEGAVKKAKRALDEFYIEGFPTNIPLHREIVRDEDFRNGTFNTSYLDKKMEIFTLHSEDNIKNEEEKIANIMKLMEAINKNKVKVKH